MEQAANSSNSEAAGWTCDRCGASLRAEELRCYVCGLFAPISERADGAQETKVQAQVIRCTSCHAAVTYSATAQNLRCAYCGEVTQVETPVDPIEESDGYLPFLVAPEAAEVALKKFWATQAKWIHRQDVSSLSQISELRAMWWPAWICTADAVFHWAVDTNEGSCRADFAPHSGEYKGSLDGFCVSASRGITEEEANGIMAGYDLASTKASADGPEIATVECFELSRSQARQKVMAAIDQKGADVVSKEVPAIKNASRKRKLQVASSLSRLSTQNMSLPAYILAYRYRNKLCRVVINAQNPEIAVGKIPMDPLRVAFAAILTTVCVVGILWITLWGFLWLIGIR